MNDSSIDIVISGAALVSGLGLTREQTWKAILDGRCGIGPITAIETALPAGADGGQAPDLPGEFEPELPREARYLKWTVEAALADARVNASPGGTPADDARRRVCILGTTLHGMRAAGRFLRSENLLDLGEMLAGRTLQTAVDASRISGLAATTCSACSSSLASIALGVTLLQTNQADMVIAGGYDPISEYVYGGFNSLRLVAGGPLKPFAKNRQGMKLAEGYGVVVLERAADAARRGVAPLAAIRGWGESADAHHLTQPHPQGDGAVRAIRQAIALAGLSPGDIDLIAAHATATPDNDAGEFRALSHAFGAGLSAIPVVAFKSHLGHTLGGAGAVELILSAMALRDQIIPACVNVAKDEVEFPELNLSIGKPRPAKIRHTLNISLGFGGANACMILGPVQAAAPTAAFASHSTSSQSTSSRDVFISGVGIVLPGIIGNDAFIARLQSSESPAWNGGSRSISDETVTGLLNARRVRRMSEYVKLTLAAATLACRDAGVDDMPAFAAECCAVLGTMHGSVNYSTAYYAQLVREGLIAANPMLFAESVPNAGAAQLSLMLGLKGACQAVIGTRTSGLDAMALAAARIQSGAWDRAIVGAAEEHCDLVNQAYRQCGLGAVEGGGPFGAETGFVAGAGSILFILESQSSLERRGGKARARIQACAAASGDPSASVESLLNVLGRLNGPANILSSACGAWIDRAETAAIGRSRGVKTVSAIYGHIAETFSASPLAGLAGVILSKKMPRLLGDGWRHPDIHPATGEESIDSVAAICTNFTGAVSGVRIAMM